MIIRAIILLFVLSISVYSQWSRIATTGNVPHLKNHSAIYHTPSNCIYTFGGRNAAGDATDAMWKLDLTTNTWSEITPVAVMPFARYTHNAHYDSVNNRMIIWSGQGAGSTLFNDVWAYNFGTNQWTQLWPDGNAAGVPNKRYGTASVFDPLNTRFVTFGGFTQSGRFEDTWSFNTNSMAWTDRSNGFHPPKRCLHAGVFAADQRKMVMYAGQHDNGYYDDIWLLNIDNFNWQNVTPAIRPSARFWNSTIYANGSVIIFGGLSTQPQNDMWKFSLSTNEFEQINQGGTIPSRRWGHSAIYIPAQDRMIMFGGEGDSLYNDTWQYSNVSVIGVEQISNIVPKTFGLEQNYPNPFNPATNIKFNVAMQGNVQIIIYDGIGHFITNLVNEELAPGTYNVDFDGSKFASGLFFCVMKTADYTETRKMILVK